MFWSSAVLTGNRTGQITQLRTRGFWSSAVLTGNRTEITAALWEVLFWSSAVLTGNRTPGRPDRPDVRFGAVPF